MTARTSAPINRQERHSLRSIDIIIHGATGYTGRRVVRHLASKYPDLRIGICGRNKNKLIAVAEEIGWDESKCQDYLLVVSDANSAKEGELVSVFSKAKVVIACAGPYRQCGLPILKAAIDARCDYLDLCGGKKSDQCLTVRDKQYINLYIFVF